MQVIVQNNNMDGAIKALKKKLAQDGFFAEIKERRFYEKPSVARKKKRAKAEKRRRKAIKNS
jgi:small subunit ribosomal protein S21